MSTPRTVNSCSNCGACCKGQVLPPGYAMLALKLPAHTAEIFCNPADIQRFNSLPEDALNLIQNQIEAISSSDQKMSSDQQMDRSCCWLDKNSLDCLFYELRPSICRDLDIDSSYCQDARQLYQVELPKNSTSRQSSST